MGKRVWRGQERRWILVTTLVIIGWSVSVINSAATNPPLCPTAGDGERKHWVCWFGGGGDMNWSNSDNWSRGVIPGPRDIAVFIEGTDDVFVDPGSSPAVAGIVLAKGFSGAVRLGRDLVVSGTVTMQSGRLEQGAFPLSAANWEQSGGEFVGGTAQLVIAGNAMVSGGLLVTPKATMRVDRLEIHASGVVRVGASGKLVITGDGEPLTGDGWLDTTTNRPTSMEYTGRVTKSITIKRPTRDQKKTEVITLDPGETGLRAAVVDNEHRFAYFGTMTSPGIVVKIDLVNMVRVGAITLSSGENNLTSAVIDSVHGFAYFGTGTTPGRVIKIRLSDFTRVDALVCKLGENGLGAAIIDSIGATAYFGTADAPARVVKINLNSFAQVGGIALSTGEDTLLSGLIDNGDNYAYFGTDTVPGRIVKIRLSDFTRVSRVTCAPGEDFLHSAVIDSVHNSAFFGTYTSPGTVVKINLADFSRAGAITLGLGENRLSAAVIDTNRNYACFFTDTEGQAVRVNLETFSSSGTLSLGEGPITSAVIDTMKGYGFAGLSTLRGKVVRVVLASSAVTSVTSSANPSIHHQTVTFVASVAGWSGVPTGTVTFKANGVTISGCDEMPLSSEGNAECSTAALGGGCHDITAAFTGSGGSAIDPSTGTMPSMQEVYLTLSVNTYGTGEGRIASSGGYIDCGLRCSYSFSIGSPVTLWAIPDDNSQFDGWSGGCSGTTDSCFAVMNDDVTVTATINLFHYPGGFYTLTPCRVFDTRDTSGAPQLGPNESRLFTVVGKCGLPNSAQAIIGNITVVNGTALGDLAVISGTLPSTPTSSISVPLGRARANNATIQLEVWGAGTIRVINQSAGTVDVILDVNGYFQ